MRLPLSVIFLQSLVTADVAYGYIDPGPSNLLIQFLIAMGAGSLFFVKRIWSSALGYFSKNKAKPQATTKGADVQPTKNKKKRSFKAA